MRPHRSILSTSDLAMAVADTAHRPARRPRKPQTKVLVMAIPLSAGPSQHPRRRWNIERKCLLIGKARARRHYSPARMRYIWVADTLPNRDRIVIPDSLTCYQ